MLGATSSISNIMMPALELEMTDRMSHVEIGLAFSLSTLYTTVPPIACTLALLSGQATRTVGSKDRCKLSLKTPTCTMGWVRE